MKKTANLIKSSVDLISFPRINVHSLHPHHGSRKMEQRKGRGVGSRRGKTCGLGHKGQGQRNHFYIKYKKFGFEGGQFPFYRSAPKRALPKKNFYNLSMLKLNKLQYWIDQGRIDPYKPINVVTMKETGLVTKIKDGVKLLAAGCTWFRSKINIEVQQASKLALQTIEDNGGSIICKYYGKQTLSSMLHPHKYIGRLIPRNPLPKRQLLNYYISRERRGFLVMTNEGRDRLKLAGISGAYVHSFTNKVVLPGYEDKIGFRLEAYYKALGNEYVLKNLITGKHSNNDSEVD